MSVVLPETMCICESWEYDQSSANLAAPCLSPAYRLAASHTASTKYVGQFPSHTVAHIARFVAFVTGSFTALLLLVTMLDETLLERPLLGRHIVWWLATLGVLLAASR